MGRIEAKIERADQTITHAIADNDGIKVTFADGCEGLIPFSAIPEVGNPLELTSIELPNPSEIVIRSSNGNVIELPWDFLRHYCDSKYREKVERIAVASMKSLGKRIRNIREEKGMTQSELATAAGIGRVTELRIEKGEQSPRYATLKSVAEALQHSMSDLISGVLAKEEKEIPEIATVDGIHKKVQSSSTVKDNGIDLVANYIEKSKGNIEKALNKALENDWVTSLKLLREVETLAPTELPKELNAQISNVWRCIQKMSINPLVKRAEDSIQMWDYVKASEILMNVCSILEVAKYPLDFEDMSLRVVKIACLACSEAGRWENTFDKKLDRTLLGISYIKSNLEELIEKDAKRRSFAVKNIKEIDIEDEVVLQR